MPRRNAPHPFDAIEALVRNGDLASARAEVRRLAAAKIARADVAELARLANRAGMPEVGIRLLGRIVRPPPRAPVKATAAEKGEYASCLLRIGAPEEALTFLGGIDPREYPPALLYRALALARRWDYPGTIPILKEYLALPGLPEYARLVGKVNLAAALVFLGRSLPATALLRELLHETSLRRLPLLHGNALELASEQFILTRQWKLAGRSLAEARSFIGRGVNGYQFLLLKWESILDFMRGETKTLDGLRAAARDRGHWEALRDCDRFTVLKTRDMGLAAHLYFGTPFEAYRKRLREELGADARFSTEYLWSPGGRGRPKIEIDLLSGRLSDGRGSRSGLKEGLAVHRFLILLASDFYRPFRPAEIHAAVHRGAFFSPISSPGRVHQLAHKLKGWFRTKRIPLSLDNGAAGYRLRFHGHVALRTSSSRRMGQPGASELETLRRRWPSGPFSTSEAVQCLGLPRRSVQRLLGGAVADKKIERRGKKGYTKYFFPGAQ